MVNPTGYTALDLIGFTDKGAYSSSANYVKNDLVHYSGNIWRCLIDDTSGVAPAEGVNWTLFIGEPTNLVERIIAPVETDPATSAWAVGRQIIYNDNLYEVIVAITAGDALVTYEDDPTNANIKLADPVETQLLNVKGNISNRNLLDNAWFTVNQRGANSYVGSTARVYTFDRWYINSYSSDITVTDNNDGTITIANTGSNDNLQFAQLLESDILISGKTYTLTCDVVAYTGSVRMLLAGNVSPYPNIINKLVDKTGYLSGKGVYDGTSNTYKVSFALYANSSITIRAVKLELGTVSTLAMDTAPNYTTELMKCQRYYVRFKNSDNGLPLAFGYLFQGNSRVACPLSVPMRDKPSFAFTTSLSGGPTFVLASGDVATDINNFTIDTDNTHQRIIFLYPNVTSGTSELAVLRLNTDVILELSADL